MQTTLKAKLSVFMFLQYFIWGSWYASMAGYLITGLKFTGPQIGAAYGALAIASIISPFIVGLIADRFFASEKLLSILGLVGGIVLCIIPQCGSFSSFYPTLLLYCILFAPTLALGNSLSLTHLANSKIDFPRVKLWSAVGWIAGGVTISLLKAEETSLQFYLAGGISILFGLFALALPHTPPTKTGADVSVKELLGLDALALLKKPSFAIFMGCMFLICIPLYFYFVLMLTYLLEIGWTSPAAKMTLAQVSDIIFLFLLPIMLLKLGYKKTISIGILAWMARYFLLAGSVEGGGLSAPMIFAAIFLHGVCYDFLFIAGQLYVDDEATPRMRGACQGFIALVLWGVGAYVGTLVAGNVMEMHVITDALGNKTHDWSQIWLTPAWLATGVLVIFLLFFRDPLKKPSHTGDLITGRKEENLEIP